MLGKVCFCRQDGRERKMKRIGFSVSIAWALALVVGNVGFAANEDTDVKTALIGLEVKSWTAWKARDGKFFDGFLSDDHVEVGYGGVIGKRDVVDGVASPQCSVESYSLSDMQFTRISQDTAVLVYRAEQKTLCGGVAVPSPVWATSVYAHRAGKWLNVVYVHTPAAPKRD
jgi:hypothetical protein